MLGSCCDRINDLSCRGYARYCDVCYTCSRSSWPRVPRRALQSSKTQPRVGACEAAIVVQVGSHLIPAEPAKTSSMVQRCIILMDNRWKLALTGREGEGGEMLVEIWNYYQSSCRVCAKVLRNFQGGGGGVPWECGRSRRTWRIVSVYSAGTNAQLADDKCMQRVQTMPEGSCKRACKRACSAKRRSETDLQCQPQECPQQSRPRCQ